MCLAVPCRVVEIVGEDPLTRVARVAFGGVVKEICLALLPEAVVDDHVLVHAGFAISRLDEDEARRVESELDRLDYDPPTDMSETSGALEPSGASPAVAAVTPVDPRSPSLAPVGTALADEPNPVTSS